MPILELTEFTELKKQSRGLLGIDHGTKVIGIAVCDKSWIISSPLTGIRNTKFTQVAEQIFKLAEEHEVSGVVIGLPLEMDGSDNRRCQSIRQFGRNLTKIKDINIYFSDESFTTTLAESNLDNADISWDRKQELVDKIAASYILQNFIDSIKPR